MYKINGVGCMSVFMSVCQLKLDIIDTLHLSVEQASYCSSSFIFGG